MAFHKNLEISKEENELGRLGIEIIDRLDIISAISCYIDHKELELVKLMSSVEYIEPDLELFMLDNEEANILVFQHGLASSGSENIDWGVSRIKAPEIWSVTTGKNVSIGIIDTGINPKHSDLKGAVLGGINVIDNGPYYDDNNHGTYVASVISARKNGLGIVGVAPEAGLYSIKAMDKSGRGYISDIIQGCQWALKSGIKLINLSLGADQNSMALHDTMEVLSSQGIIVIAATGNDGKEGIFSPAKENVTICVGASDMKNQRASWSCYGHEMMKRGVLAPGDWIMAASKDGSWQKVSGTSIATPHVTGLVALLLGVKDLGPEAIRGYILNNSSQFSNPDEFHGYGVVNAKKALDSLMVFR